MQYFTNYIDYQRYSSIYNFYSKCGEFLKYVVNKYDEEIEYIYYIGNCVMHNPKGPAHIIDFYLEGLSASQKIFPNRNLRNTEVRKLDFHPALRDGLQKTSDFVIRNLDCNNKIMRGMVNYYINGLRHNTKGPASLSYYKDNIQQVRFYVNNVLHNDNGYALIEYYKNGNVQLCIRYINGLSESNNNIPSSIHYYSNGIVKSHSYSKNGKRHRDDGPALIEYHKNGTIKNVSFYKHGELIK
jgi:antitoxin component YwqK of YwqJK toxin-antitoxin module